MNRKTATEVLFYLMFQFLKNNNSDMVKQELLFENGSSGTNGTANYADGSEVAAHDTKVCLFCFYK